MLKELYTRNPDDALYVENVYEIESSLENLIGQIRMLLFTKPGEIINDLAFGIDIESLVFSTNLSNVAIQEKISTAIYRYCPDAGEFTVKRSVEFYKGTARDMCLIDISIDGTKYLGILIK